MKKTEKSVLDVFVESTMKTKSLIQKLVYLLVIFTLAVSSLSLPDSTVMAKSDTVSEKPIEKTSSYRAPSFSHPQAVMGERPKDQLQEETPDQPIFFIENEGQTDANSHFQVMGNNSVINFVEDGIWLSVVEPDPDLAIKDQIENIDEEGSVNPTAIPENSNLSSSPEHEVKGVNVHAIFDGANPNPVIEGFDPISTKVSFFKGSDSTKWNSEVPVWGGIRYLEIYPGYDLEITSKNGQLTQQLVQNETYSNKSSSFFDLFKPQVNMAQELNFTFEGVQDVEEVNNQKVLSTGIGEIPFPIINSNDSIVPTEDYHSFLFSTESTPTSTLKAGQQPAANSMFNFSTYIAGGFGQEIIVDDATGDSFTVGFTGVPDFPVVPGGFQTNSHGLFEIVVFKLTNDGKSLEYATYLGGSKDDIGLDLALGSDKAVYLTGWTYSPDFPTTAGSYDPTFNNARSPIIAKLSSDGTQLVYSTYLGAGQGHNIVVDSLDYAYITGSTNIGSFPTTSGAYDRIYGGGGMDGFVTKLNQAGSTLVYSTFIGGSGSDCQGSLHNEIRRCDISVNSGGEVTMAGMTSSSNFPTSSNAYDRTFNGLSDVFVLRLNTAGSNITYSTFVGGPGGDSQVSVKLVVDALGATFVTGQTNDSNFPTTDGAFQRAVRGDFDSFIFKLSPDGSNLEFSTLLGGNDSDVIYDLALTNSGQPIVFGQTFSTNFPVTSFGLKGRLNCVYGLCFDAFITEVNSNGTWLNYSTLFGGNASDWTRGIDIAADDSIYVTGMTGSSDFPKTPGVFRTIGQGDTIYVSNIKKVQKLEEYSAISFGSEDCSDCWVTYKNTQSGKGDPVNTRTGGFNLPFTDLSFNTSAGNLSFSRDYSSLSVGQTSSHLGYGWTHNLDSRLIFPGDPGGETGKILVKVHSANLYGFKIQQDETFTPVAGVLASLTKTTSNPDQYELVTSAQEKFSFNEAGKIVTWSNAVGNGMLYQYDSSGRLEQVSANNGQRYLQLSYNERDLISTVSDHSGRSVSYGYNDLGEMTTFVDLMGRTWTFTYDGNHRMLEAGNPLEQTKVRNEYDDQGRVVRQFDGNNNLIIELSFSTDGITTVTNALGHTEVVHHDPMNVVAREEDAAGGGINKDYDVNFRPTKITDSLDHTTELQWSADGANLSEMLDAAGNATDLTYDAYNNVTSIIDPRSNLTQNLYENPDHPTLLTQTIDASNAATIYTYTAEGLPETVTDPSGNVTQYTYDEFGQRISTQITSIPDVFGVTRTIVYQYSYDSLGRLLDTSEAHYSDGSNPEIHITHNEYNAADNLSRVVRNYDPNRGQNESFGLPEGGVDFYNIVTSYEYDELSRQVLVTDTYGHATHYQYDAAGHLVKTIDPAGHESTSTYNEAGQLVSTSDALGRSTSYAYDEAGRQISTTDTLGHTTSTTYNLDGTVASSSDARGKTTTYTYDELKRVIAVTDPLGNVTHTSYDATGNVASTTDPSGYVITSEYDPLNRLIKQNYPQIGNGGSTASNENFYDSNGNLIQTIDRNGNRTTNYYDGLNRLIKVEDALGNSATYEYDARGNRTVVVDGRQGRSEYTYDSQGRVVVTHDPSGFNTTTQYDAVGKVITSTNAEGKATHYEYDEIGRLIKEINLVGGETIYTYDAVGNRLTSTDPNGHTTTYTYDQLNRVTAVADANGNSATTSYDNNGNVIAATNGAGETTTFEYDDLNRQVKVINPLGKSTEYSYDANGNRSSIKDARGNSTHFEYDPLARLTAVIENYQPGVNSNETINVRTEYSYDANGNRLRIQDGNGHATSFAYDTLNRKTGETDSLGNSTQYEYDELGNRKVINDANGATINYAYSPRGELTEIQYPTSNVSFTYNGLGQRTKMVDPHGETNWTYNDQGQITQVQNSGSSVQYEYDAAGNRTKLIYPDGKTATYSYDPANRLQNVTTAWRNSTTTYAYDAANRLINATLPNGIQSNYTYDNAGHLTRLVHQKTEQQWASYQYEYDELGNRTKATEAIALPAFQPFVSVTVKDSQGNPLEGLQVYAFNGQVYAGFSAMTGEDGVARFTLPEGDFHFRADQKGFQYWSSEQNDCTVLGCEKASITVPIFGDVTVTIKDSSNIPLPGLPVYAFEGTKYIGVNGISDESGQVKMTLPQGNYRFRTDKNGLQFFSGEEGHCSVPTCTVAGIKVPQFGSVTVTVKNSADAAEAGIPVYAFEGTTYTGANAVTDTEGHAVLIMPEGNYRFRADKNNLQYWSSPENNCSVVGCEAAAITVPIFGNVTLTVTDSTAVPQADLPVYVFDGETYTGQQGVTNASGQVTLTIPEGEYRFRADKYGHQYFSDSINHCTVPACESVAIQVPRFGEVIVTVKDSAGAPQNEQPVYVFDGDTYTGINGQTGANGQATLMLPEGNYRFRSDRYGHQYWSDSANHCTVPECTTAVITVLQYFDVTVHVTNAIGTNRPNLTVYVYDGSNNIGINGLTNENGNVTFNLPEGSYRFRADIGEQQIFSGTENHCTVPACTQADFIVNNPAEISQVTVHVFDTANQPVTGLSVWAAHNNPYSSKTAITDENGNAIFSLVYGEYQFGFHYANDYYSSPVTLCNQPDCGIIQMEVPQSFPVLVTVVDANGAPRTGYYVSPQKSNGINISSQITDENGQTSFRLIEGDYRFSVNLYFDQPYGQKIWSGETYHCGIPGCEAATITIPQSTPVQVTVVDINGVPQSELSVSATNSEGVESPIQYTDDNGRVSVELVEGNYRFSVNITDEQRIWSGETYHCVVPGCEAVTITIPQLFPVLVTAVDENGVPPEWGMVAAINSNGTTSQNYTLDGNGQVSLRLFEGNYRFSLLTTDYQQFWSGETYHCAVPGCDNVTINYSLSYPVQVTVVDENNLPQVDLAVSAVSSDEHSYSGQNTDANGQSTIQVPAGSYRFSATTGSRVIWSGETYHCVVQGCGAVTITIPTEQSSIGGGIYLASFMPANHKTTGGPAVLGDNTSVEVLVTDTASSPQIGLNVYAFNDTTYTGVSAVTDDTGKAVLSLPDGSYRFRIDKFNRQYWSGSSNHCTTPECTTNSVIVPVFGLVTTTVTDTSTVPATGLAVYAFDGSTYTGFNGTTNESGQAIFNLPEGNYRFRTDKNGSQYWSGGSNHCTVPQCTEAAVTVPVFGSVAVSVHTSANAPEAGLNVYVFNATSYTGFNGVSDETGTVNFVLPEGSYRFRADKNGQQYFSEPANHCTVVGCESAAVIVPVFGDVAVHVATSGGTVQTGVTVYAFNEATYTGFSAVTNASGDATYTLPEGNYRFRADKNGVQYWSGESNHCAVPGCTTAAVTVPVFGTVAVTVTDTGGAAQADVPVYVFNEATYTGFNATTDAQGQASLTLPEGNYRLRADKNSLQYWSGESNHCAVPTCTAVAMTLPVFGTVTLTVSDSTSTPQAEIPVYVFDGSTYKGFTAVTDSTGQATFTLPAGAYRFRADVHGHQYWSGTENHCTVAGCSTAAITTPRFGQVTVTVQYRDNEKLPDLPVYAFSGETYSGISGTSDALGQVQLWLPEGNYRFRADQNKLPFWSGTADHCAIPGCENATISTYATGSNPVKQQVISYTYDALNRLTAADYDAGTFYHYSYDAVGNRMQETKKPSAALPEVVNTYQYDVANRLTDVNGTTYTWDANGNLTSDGVNTYTYNSANRLTRVTSIAGESSFAYNGLGDRVSQIVDGTTTNYSLDLNAGLTQVLADGTNTYLYGNGRISQETPENIDYYLTDALGSVRQVQTDDPTSKIVLARDYAPYGEVSTTSGAGKSAFGFTGEMQSGGLVHLRSRDYAPADGRFLSRDSWEGDYSRPLSLNKWMYVEGNPANRIDPSGKISCKDSDDSECMVAVSQLKEEAQRLKTNVIGEENNPQNRLKPIDALSKLTAFAYGIFENDRRGMMWGMTKVLVGIDPNDYHHLTLQPAKNILQSINYENLIGVSHEGEYFVGEDWLPYKNTNNILDKGDWNRNYFDETPNQAFHFWYYAASRYFDSEILANFANIYHDPYFLEDSCGQDLQKFQNSKFQFLDTWSQNVSQTSKEDFDLAIKGIQFGSFMSSPRGLSMSPDTWIKNNLME